MKKNIKKLNHEVFETCTECGAQIDIKTENACSFCKTPLNPE